MIQKRKHYVCADMLRGENKKTVYLDGQKKNSGKTVAVKIVKK